MVKVNNLVKLHILAALAAGKTHGYELMKKAGARVGKRLSASHVYPFLKELEEGGFIIVKAEQVREKKIYALTPEGRKLAREVMARVDDVVAYALKSRLIECAHCSCRVYSGEHVEKIGGKELAFCCCHCAASYRERAKRAPSGARQHHAHQ